MAPVEFPWRAKMNSNPTFFQSKAPSSSSSSSSSIPLTRKRTPGARNKESPPPKHFISRIVEITSDDSDNMAASADTSFPSHIPSILAFPPQFPAEVETESFLTQKTTGFTCRALFQHPLFPIITSKQTGEATPLPQLKREKHIEYLRATLSNDEKLHLAMDPSRPWVVYWCIASLAALGENVETEEYRKGVIGALKNCQNPTGGFGGGHGHISHCAPSYAAVLALSIVGGDEALSVVNRQKMWEWLGQMKQADGGFIMNEGGELDVRGAFCTVVILSILDLPVELPPNAPARKAGLKTFVCQLGEWISKCQTYEGGIGSCPGGEAHGAFAFCALNTLALFGPPQTTLSRYLNLPSFFRWMSYRQSSEGGFAGRSNKLVDGCYSHWVGSTWSMIDAAISGAHKVDSASCSKGAYEVQTDRIGLSDWLNKNAGYINQDLPETWSRAELIHYTLHCCQEPKGGMIDKPGVRPDAYHTLYNLVGLSAAQNRFYMPDRPELEDDKPRLLGPYGWKFVPILNPATPNTETAEYRPEKENANKVGDDDDDYKEGEGFSSRVKVFHPAYVVPWGVPERTWSWYHAREWRE